MQIVSILIGVFQFIDQIYKSLIGILWYTCVHYGLSPHFAFLLPFLGNSSYASLNASLFNGLFFQFSVIVLLIASVVALAVNSFSKNADTSQFLLKWTVSVLVGGVSILAITWMMAALGTIYTDAFNSAGVNWYNFLNFSSSSYVLGGGNARDGALGVLIEIFALTGYFVSVISLLAVLVMRQALMLFSIVLVPFATILGSTRRGGRFANIIWEIILEMSVYPFLVLLCLYLAHIFSWDVPLQLAFLFLPSIIPGMLFATGNSFLSAPIFGFIGGMSLAGTAGKGLEAASIASMPFRGGSLGGALKDGAMLPFREKNFINQIPRSGIGKTEMPWKEMLNEELKSREQ